MVDFDEVGLYQSIGSRLRVLRGAAGISQAELADKVGLLRTSISNIEAGRQKLNLAVIYKTCLALNVNLTDLLPGIEEVSGSSKGSPLDEHNLPPKSANALARARKDIDAQ